MVNKDPQNGLGSWSRKSGSVEEYCAFGLAARAVSKEDTSSSGFSTALVPSVLQFHSAVVQFEETSPKNGDLQHWRLKSFSN
jgi:hypothetical protein